MIINNIKKFADIVENPKIHFDRKKKNLFN